MIKAINGIFVYYVALAPFVLYIARLYLDIGFYSLTLLVIILLLFFIIATYSKVIRFPKYLIFFLLFTLYSIFSDIFIAEKEVTLKYFYSNKLIISFLIFFAIENLHITFHLIKRINKVNLIVLIIAFFTIIIQQTINEDFFVSEIYLDKYDVDIIIEKRLPSIYSWVSPIASGFTFVPILALILSKYIKQRSKIFWVLYLMGAIFSFLTKNRWIMFGFLTLIFLLPIYRRVNIINLVRYPLVAGIIIFLGLKILSQFSIPVEKIIQERIFSESRGGILEGSAGTRILAFQVFAKLFPENAILGRGNVHTFGGDSEDKSLISELGGHSSQIHVGYLSILYYYGIVGGALYFIFLYLFVGKLFKLSKYTNEWGPFFGFLMYLTANLTLVYFDIIQPGLIMALIYYSFLNNISKKNKIIENQKIVSNQNFISTSEYSKALYFRP